MPDFSGKRILATGTFLGTRQQVNNYIRRIGAEPASTLSNSLDIIVIGEKAGSIKLDYALQKNIVIISEKEFYDLTDVLPSYASINRRGTLRDFNRLLPVAYINSNFNRDIGKYIGGSNLLSTASGTVVPNKPKNFLKFDL